MAVGIPEDRAAVGRQRALAVRQARAADRQQTAALAYAVVDEMADVAPATLRAALTIARRLDADTESLPVSDWLDAQRAANTAEILHRISRLASGQSTSNVAHAQLSSEERAERLAQLDALRQGPPAPTE